VSRRAPAAPPPTIPDRYDQPIYPVAVQRESLAATQCLPPFLSLASLSTVQPMKSMSTPYLPPNPMSCQRLQITRCGPPHRPASGKAPD